jgi:hypothetical protein
MLRPLRTTRARPQDRHGVLGSQADATWRSASAGSQPAAHSARRRYAVGPCRVLNGRFSGGAIAVIDPAFLSGADPAGRVKLRSWEARDRRWATICDTGRTRHGECVLGSRAAEPVVIVEPRSRSRGPALGGKLRRSYLTSRLRFRLQAISWPSRALPTGSPCDHCTPLALKLLARELAHRCRSLSRPAKLLLHKNSRCGG